MYEYPRRVESMKAEIIAVGSELLTPDYVDTNSLFITQRLNEAGFLVQLKTIVGDNEEDIAGVLRAALQRSKLIIFSGGLGPTEDDLTRPTVARVLGRSIQMDQAILDELRQKFASRGYSMSRNNERQAEVIENAEVLENAFGTAPGMWIEENGVYLALLPGPPREIQPMFDSAIMPRIRRLGVGRRVARKSFSILGMTESEVDSRAAPIYTAYPHVQSTILAQTTHIALRFSQWLDVEEEPTELEDLAARIHAVLGDAIFTTADESVEEVIGRLLGESARSLAVAESCTAGLVAARITRIPGSSNYFMGGVLCYSNEAKTGLCRVPEDVLAKHGAVSGETAEALSQGVREVFHSSVGLSVTGIAGPGGGSQEKPVGLVYVGLSNAERTLHVRRILPGNREVVRERAAFFALSCLRRFLMPVTVSEKK